MSAAHKARPKMKGLLDEVLDFGPDHAPCDDKVSTRLQELVKKLQEISARIDRLASRF